MTFAVEISTYGDLVRNASFLKEKNIFASLRTVNLCVKEIFMLCLTVFCLCYQCKVFWHQKGDYLAVKVDRYTKSKKVRD